ncbi:MAG: hypothetical protein B7Y56_15900 [Gallionellales bacterium 35-53-114]|jgi:hypothetical protein|nr:MAG: hypothetical protein B7Y56_15900 [Gallionellales bacterium 35-53-114]HQS60016.1 hypothetical protein [Gallionellaceae bacterium]
MKATASFLWDLLYFLTGEGTWRLRTHERLVLEAAIASLPDDIQSQLRAQFNQMLFVQRSNRQISRPRFYSIPLEGNELPHNLLKVEIDVGGKKESAHVEFFQGRVDSIQFKHPGKFYSGKALKVDGVKAGNPKVSHAAAIDRSEHGSQHT